MAQESTLQNAREYMDSGTIENTCSLLFVFKQRDNCTWARKARFINYISFKFSNYKFAWTKSNAFDIYVSKAPNDLPLLLAALHFSTMLILRDYFSKVQMKVWLNEGLTSC